jgi:8-oxo-dGTP diphosphatase
VDSESGFSVTCDAVLFHQGGAGRAHVLVIRRSDDSDAYPGAWALPGGYVEVDESIDDAVRRELFEETGISAPTLTRFGLFDAVGRDPRGRVISVAYVAIMPTRVEPIAGDDAAEARWVSMVDLLRDGLAFDHVEILLHAFAESHLYGARD